MDLDDDWESPDKSGAVVWLRYVSHIHETKLQTDSSSRPFSLGNVRAHCDGECRTKAQLPAFLHRNPPAMSDVPSPFAGVHAGLERERRLGKSVSHAPRLLWRFRHSRSNL